MNVRIYKQLGRALLVVLSFFIFPLHLAYLLASDKLLYLIVLVFFSLVLMIIYVSFVKRNKELGSREKRTWILLIIFLPSISIPVYCFKNFQQIFVLD